MKQIIIAVTVILALACTSCGSRQKPSSRVNVWSEDATSITMNANKVLVPFTRTASGLAEVQVSLNGVPFNMWWDTGASITCISALELMKMAKEGKITLDDYVGEAVSKLADGSSTEEVVFNIKEIYIQGKDNKYLRLTDVDAVVSGNDEAPLLIGQNVISNLPRHRFNDSTGVIEFDN